jgi:uncharacterized protein YjiS (DUF1127 family)
MRNRLIRFALWLGIIEYFDEEREARQELDRIMFYTASDEVWSEYMRTRWTLATDTNKPPVKVDFAL